MDDVVRNYARDVLGMQREDLNEFLWIADEAMRAPLPDGWEQHEDESRGKPYYVNEDTGETQWTHPSDDFYREKFQRQQILIFSLHYSYHERLFLLQNYVFSYGQQSPYL